MSDVPSMYQGHFERAQRSRASAIKAMCLECVGFVRKDVTDCTCESCPLWTWRPYQVKAEEVAS